MVDKSKKGKKAAISEGDMSALLQRYSLCTVLGLLQEVEQAAGEKIDWREVVKNSVTGISGAREYQMLWRHIAYGEALIDQLDEDAEPIHLDLLCFKPLSSVAIIPTGELNGIVRILPGSHIKTVEELPEGEFCTEEVDEYCNLDGKGIANSAVSCKKAFLEVGRF